MAVFRKTTEGIFNFREGVRNWAYECVKHAEGPLTDETLAKYRENYLSDMDIAEEDHEDAKWHFDIAFTGAWQEANAELYVVTELYVVLAKTQHDTPVWYTSSDQNPDNKELIPIMVLGPYLIGPDGYKTVKDAVENDPNFLGSLDEPISWDNLDSYNGEYFHRFLDQRLEK